MIAYGQNIHAASGEYFSSPPRREWPPRDASFPTVNKTGPWG